MRKKSFNADGSESFWTKSNIIRVLELVVILATALGAWLGQQTAQSAKVAAESAEVKAAENSHAIQEVKQEVNFSNRALGK